MVRVRRRMYGQNRPSAATRGRNETDEAAVPAEPTNEPSFAGAEAREGAVPVWPLTPGALGAWLDAQPERTRNWLRSQGFEASRRAVCAVPDEKGGVAGIAFGLGEGDPPDRAFGDLPQSVPPGTYRIDAVSGVGFDAEMAALGWLLGAYAFRRYKSETETPPSLVAPEGADEARVLRLARGAWLTRDLINTPAGDMGPAELEAAVRSLAERHGAALRTVVGAALLTENYPMIHAVGRAGPQEPRLIDLRWSGPDAGLSVTLVGKGVCFDTGGLDIKPSRSMLLMKKDMGGAASVLGLASMIMDAGLPVRLRVLIPAVENSVSSNSFRPGDVLIARNGIAVENRNTDAEGRLVLADALVDASEEDPDLLFDLATLTGAARVALGPDLPPFYTDDDALATEIAAAGRAMHDPVWRMPLWDGYERDIRSQVGEITNAPGGGMAGSVTAALFLRRFLRNSYKWAHFDIYGWAPRAKPGRPEGGECQAALALYKVIEDRCG